MKKKIIEIALLSIILTATVMLFSCNLGIGPDNNNTNNPVNPNNSFVAVNSITGVPTSGTVGNLYLTGTVYPLNATNKTIEWSLLSAGTTGANISGSTLTTTAAGDVTVRATIANGAAQGTPYMQAFPITIAPIAAIVDYTSHNTNYSILVRNNTGERLVAFKGDLWDSQLIGGIPAHAQNHGLPYDPALFDKTEDFPMILLTETQYNANKNNLSVLKNTPFTRLYVFFNKSGDNSVVYEIAAGLGGNNEFKIINASSSINVELRLGGAAGETIGYAPAGILETTLRLQDGNYNIFPVFKRYNTFRDVVETSYPQGTGSGYAWFESYSFGEGTTSATMNLKDLLQNTTFVLGAAWVHVNNQTNAGIRFVEGSNVRATASGLTNIMNSNPRTFQIDMPKMGNNTYADSITVSNWKFGATGFEVGLQQGENDSAPVTSLEIQQGKMYTITVTGSHNDGSLKAWISQTTEIEQNEIGGTW